MARPRREDVIAAYDLGVETYEGVWSPVILPPVRAVVTAMDLRDATRILDVGAGAGAVIPTIQDASTSATVIAIDASAEMLRVAHARTGAAAVQADALALPVVDAIVDAVLLAFVLFHLSDPPGAIAEVGRVLRTGGLAGTVTWSREGSTKAHQVWDEVLAGAGVPAAPLRRVDTGLDSEEGIDALLTTAGLRPLRIWLEPLEHRWTLERFWQLVNGSGVNRFRLAQVDAQQRRDAVARARQQLERLEPEDFAWWGEVVCGLATKSAS